MNEMKEQFPSAARVIIDERDRYLTAMLQATARQPQKVPKSMSQSGMVPPVVVAVVGIGHQKGSFFNKLNKIQLNSHAGGWSL